MNLYSKRRELLLKNLGDNVCVLFFSSNAVMKSEDEQYPFYVNRNFYYLTGLERENMVLMLTKYNGVASEFLFILPYDEKLAKWVGGRMSKEEASEISDVKNVMDYSLLDDMVAGKINRMRIDNTAKFYLDLWHYSMDQANTLPTEYAKKLKDKYPQLIIKDIFPYITKMRLIKDEYEITCIKQAIHLTDLGIQTMMKTIKPGLNEMVMEGVFEFALKQNICRNIAFPTIAASGTRATILHYRDNDQIMKDGELFLCDLGATFKNYNADISRTFPVNGKYSSREKELYYVVLGAQKIVENNAKAGVSMKDLNQMVINYYKAELPLHGLNKDVSEYYYHSVSHHLGLDVHDVDSGLGAVLEAGNVITNEPGLYIADEGIGIRIEDDLLITGSGCEVLSKEIIKIPDDIEKYMAK